MSDFLISGISKSSPESFSPANPDPEPRHGRREDESSADQCLRAKDADEAEAAEARRGGAGKDILFFVILRGRPGLN